MVAVLKLPLSVDLQWNVRNALICRLDNLADKIEVTVLEGAVRLSGSVTGLAIRNEAEWTAFGVPGVTEVENELRVVRNQIYCLRDFDLKNGAEQLLRWNFLLRGKGVHVGCHKGVVFLSGIVGTDAERSEAQRLVSTLPDLAGVENYIEVRPRFRSDNSRS